MVEKRPAITLVQTEITVSSMNGSALKIAVVDDSVSITQWFADLIEKTIPDIDVIIFNDSTKALDWCRGHDIDLIITDYLMPNMDGLHFIEALREDARLAEVPVIMVTSQSARKTRYAALQLGATDFLNKPVDEYEFVTRVRNILDLRIYHKKEKRRAIELAEAVSRATQAIIERERETVLVLCKAAEQKDDNTAAHLVRMSSYCRIVGKNLALDGETLDTLFRAAPMHDIGKIGVPDRILMKPGPLDPEEWRAMQMHPVWGHEILSGNSSPLLVMAAEIALTHHERWDGKGYPGKLSGSDIPLVGRITAVADVFDALTTRRPYKAPWSVEESLRHLSANAGTQFDPECIDAFMSGLDEVSQVIEEVGIEP